jgi:hypothetical protein
MAASSPCFYGPVVICRTLIFRLFFLLLKLSPSLEASLIQLSPSLEEPPFQNLPKIQSGVGYGPYFRAALAAKHASACVELSGCLVARAERKPSLWGTLQSWLSIKHSAFLP